MTISEPNPVMVQIFGEPPEGLELTQSTSTRDTAATIALMVLAVIALLLRFLARRLQQSGLKMDDWTIILALVRLSIIREKTYHVNTTPTDTNFYAQAFIGGTVGISIASGLPELVHLLGEEV